VKRSFRWSPRALRDIEGLESAVQKGVLDAVDSLETAGRFPGPPIIKKLAGRTATFRLRVGDFRLIYVTTPSHHLVLRVIDRKELESVLRHL
jgi:mRNA-degrading endonuclease RelE of RelBE toxin-antitoxin system